MKKITTLIALILCVTIGGVYAAWTYTGNTVSSVDRTVSHGLTTTILDGDVGLLQIVSNSADIAIDQTDVGNYTAKLVVTGEIVVKFTPNTGADQAVLDNAVPVKATLYTKNAESNLYEGAPIYVSPADSYVDIAWEKQEDGTFLGTLSAAQIDTLIDLGGSFYLDTLTEYNAFHALEENITLTVMFSQSAVVAQ